MTQVRSAWTESHQLSVDFLPLPSGQRSKPAGQKTPLCCGSVRPEAAGLKGVKHLKYIRVVQKSRCCFCDIYWSVVTDVYLNVFMTAATRDLR